MRRLVFSAFVGSLLVGCTCGSNPPKGLECGDAGLACDGGCVTIDDSNCGACGVHCGGTEACAAAACYPVSCPGSSCGPAQVCVSDNCVDRSCVGVTCAAETLCAAGRCEPTSCGAQSCGAGQVCFGGVCLDAACVGVACPPGQQCAGGRCSPGHCFNHAKDSDETAEDCGGTCGGCASGRPCTINSDCASGLCDNGTCATSSGCSDGKKNGKETAVDCGGGSCTGCGTGMPCSKPGDCLSNSCGPGGVCLGGPTCSDGQKNQDETDQDCGGGTCPKCGTGKQCKGNLDCLGNQCTADGGTGVCATTPCSNMMQDGLETDTDCGGPTCNKCALNKVCLVKTDCLSNACQAGHCVAGACNDAMVDGLETDLDCGGGVCPGCATGKICLLNRDCDSLVCDGTKKCAAPSCTDNVQNGSEGGVDCGGTCFPCGLAAPVFLTVGNNPKDAVAFDFDGDGNLDLAVNSINDSNLAVLRGNGDSTFKPRQNYSTSVGQTHMVIGKMDSDSLMDLVLSNPAAPGVGLHVMLGADGGSFGVPIPYTPAWGYMTQPAVGDLNNDGKMDVVLGGYIQVGAIQKLGPSVLLGQGNGGFNPAISTDSMRGNGPEAIGEINGDGMKDVVVMGNNGQIEAFPGLGNGNLGGGAMVDTTMNGGNAQWLTLADLNGDGKDDIIALSNNVLRIYVNVGNGTFNLPTSYPPMGAIVGMAVGKLNGDAFLDVVVATNFQSPGLAVFLGTGTGVLTGPTIYPIPGQGGVALGDFNNDGKVDVAVVCTGNTVGLMLNRY